MNFTSPSLEAVKRIYAPLSDCLDMPVRSVMSVQYREVASTHPALHVPQSNFGWHMAYPSLIVSKYPEDRNFNQYRHLFDMLFGPLLQNECRLGFPKC
jgi:hypothetical protein